MFWRFSAISFLFCMPLGGGGFLSLKIYSFTPSADFTQTSLSIKTIPSASLHTETVAHTHSDNIPMLDVKVERAGVRACGNMLIVTRMTVFANYMPVWVLARIFSSFKPCKYQFGPAASCAVIWYERKRESESCKNKVFMRAASELFSSTAFV